MPAPPRPMMMMRAEAAADATQVVAGESELRVSLSVRFLLK